LGKQRRVETENVKDGGLSDEGQTIIVFAILFLLAGILLSLGIIAERQRGKKRRQFETALRKAFEGRES
jgi:hypothetical protein